MVEMEVYGLAVESDTEAPVLVLKSEELGLVLPIWIGALEAMAISMVLNEVSLPRPMTHDLLLNTIATFGGKVVSVDVVDIDQGTFYAEIVIDKEGERVVIDARPSDAVALAVRAECPVNVARKVLDTAGTKDTEQKVIDKSDWESELEELSPDDFKYKM